MTRREAIIIHADARRLPLADASVDLIVTSPPYWALRSYQDAGEHYDAQIGAEATPQEYLESLWECTREWMRVLKPEGSLWINLGDKYATTDHPNNCSGDGLNGNAERKRARQESNDRVNRRNDYGAIQQKSLLGLPWRYAIGCIDQLGLILRAEVVWSKPNGLPESVKDRVRRSHEQWFHLVKQQRYYAAVDEVREPHRSANYGRISTGPAFGARRNGDRNDSSSHRDGRTLGRLPGSVWEIATQPLKVPDELGIDHFAAFPMGFPRRIITGWSPPGICVDCGQGRRPQQQAHGETPRERLKRVGASERHQQVGGQGLDWQGGHNAWRTFTIAGYVCDCDAPTADTTPSVVLDPFGGTGTTALVASALGRRGISVDASADYCRLARWRTTNQQEIARAMDVPKPTDTPDPKVQPSLFDAEGSS